MQVLVSVFGQASVYITFVFAMNLYGDISLMVLIVAVQTLARFLVS